MKASVALFLFAGLFLVSGCKPTAGPAPGGTATTGKATPAAEVAPADDATSLAALKEKSVKLDVDGNGNVVLADFRKTETSDEDLALLKGLPKVSRVIVEGPNFGDAVMVHLADLPNFSVLFTPRPNRSRMSIPEPPLARM